MKKKDLYGYIKHMLATNKTWQTRALVTIFDRQTETEKAAESTMLHNNIGFTGCDGQILASFAKQWLNRKWLSAKQFSILNRRIPRYWHQIYEISDKTKLETQAISWVQEHSEQMNLIIRDNKPEELVAHYESEEE